MIKIVNSNEKEITCEISGDIVNNDELFLREILNGDITTPNDVKKILNDNKSTNITFNINSNGGDVFAGTAIANMIKFHKGKTVANIQSLSASIASVIALSCDKIKMPKNAYLMIHKPFAFANGTSDDLRGVADLLDKIQENIEDVYIAKVKNNISREEITEFINKETWFNGLEASKIFDIELLEDVEVLNCITNIQHKNQPSFFYNKKELLSAELKEEIEQLKKMEV